MERKRLMKAYYKAIAMVNNKFTLCLYLISHSGLQLIYLNINDHWLKKSENPVRLLLKSGHFICVFEKPEDVLSDSRKVWPGFPSYI